ncbi:thioredoxin family protein [Hymenobacter sp. B1770]|uniref:thioredoxin family protein n=1 Tax=Hymenobacter sp. B1770 TaxID=1718788 RepID=UPI003CF0E1FF
MSLISSSFLLLLMLTLGSSSRPKPSLVRWVTPQALADSLRVRPRPVLVFVHTTWCQYCKLQEMTTFRHGEVTRRLNAGYYAVSLDAESRAPIRLGGETFGFKATGPTTGVHTLALALARDEQGQLAYPTTVLLDERLQVRGRWAGLLKPSELVVALEKLSKASQP